MKLKNSKKITALIAALLVCAVTSANALTEAQIATVKKAFNRVPVPELAPKAAQMVAQAPAADKEQMAVTVVRTVVTKHNNLAVPIVSAIVTVAPETAPAVAAEAAKIAKDSSEMIAVVAVKAAPAKSEQIAQQVGKAVPNSAEKVTARVRSTMRSAANPFTGGTIGNQPGVIGGLAKTPPIPPTPVSVAPVKGFDPLRYQQP